MYINYTTQINLHNPLATHINSKLNRATFYSQIFLKKWLNALMKTYKSTTHFVYNKNH